MIDRELDEMIESGLGSKGRLRLIRALAEKPDMLMTKYALEKRSRLNPVRVRAGLAALVRLGWVKEYRGDLVKYQLNMENEIVRHILRFFRDVGYL